MKNLSYLILSVMMFSSSSFSAVYTFANANLCARQSLEPASSVFILMDGFAPGRAAMKRAYDLNRPSADLVRDVWAEYHKRSYYLTNKLMNHLIDNELPLIPDEILKSCNSGLRSCLTLKQFVLDHWQKNLDSEIKNSVKCTWIKKSIPVNFTTKNPNRSDLEQLAVSYLDKNNYIDRCENIVSNTSQSQPDLVLRFNLPGFDKDKEKGFKFWTSFKIYMTYIWGQKINSTKFKFEDLSRSFSVDELMTIMADGCQSISRPECSSDFLNTSQFRDIIKKGKFENNYLMANEILKAEVAKTKAQLNQDPGQVVSDDSFEVRKQLLATMKFRHQANFQFYNNFKILKTLFNQKSTDILVIEAMKHNSSDSLKEVLCSEVGKFINEAISGFAKEVNQARNLFAQSKEKDLIQLWEKSIDLALKLKPYCAEVESNLRKKMISSSADIDSEKTKKWFKTITQYSLPFDIKTQDDEKRSTPVNPYVKLGSEVICEDPVDCVRNVISASVNLYQTMLFRNQIANQSANEINGKSNLSAAVACQLYDPWAASQLRKKKLISDMISSVISGVTMLPIYLDLTFKRPDIISFKQLVDKGAVKFDPIFNEDDVKKTIFLDLGPLAKSPCYLSLSNSQDLKLHQNRYIFSGITFQGCMKSAEGEMATDLLNLSENKLKELSVCGSCTLNFEEVALAAVQSNYSLFRAGLRFFGSLIYYFKETENPNTNPIEYQVDSDYVVETYKKYSAIPDKCVHELIHGAKCMEDLCVSKTVAEYEKVSGYKVTTASIWNSNNESNFSGGSSSKDVWLKVEGCDREYRVPIVCEDNKLPSFINISSYLKDLSCARKAGI
jgi:hypothetical protein